MEVDLEPLHMAEGAHGRVALGWGHGLSQRVEPVAQPVRLRGKARRRMHLDPVAHHRIAHRRRGHGAAPCPVHPFGREHGCDNAAEIAVAGDGEHPFAEGRDLRIGLQGRIRRDPAPGEGRLEIGHLFIG
ncbi:dehydrogenase [Cereibacter sphaeroides KD131]|nr:dehydrogenase [Cereibacter sphaeroides KD131]